MTLSQPSANLSQDIKNNLQQLILAARVRAVQAEIR